MICDMKSKCVNSGLNYHSKINHVVNLVKSKIVVKLLENFILPENFILLFYSVLFK